MSITAIHDQKNPKRGFLGKWILCSTVGGIFGLTLFSITSMIIFFGLSDIPKQANLHLLPASTAIREGLGIGTILAIGVGLPLGIAQWIILYWRFKVFRTFWWAPAYCIGTILPISAIVTMWLFYKPLLTLPVLILSWFTAGVTTGSLQWMILRRLISRGFWLVPCNLIAILGFMLWVAFGGTFDELINFIVFIIGGFLGPLLYGIITGLIIHKSKEQPGSTIDSTPSGVR